MSVNNLAEYGRSFTEGKNFYCPFFKSSVPAVGAGRWCDISMGAGQPRFNAYVGGQLEATPMNGFGNFGLFTGGASSGEEKYLHKLGAVTNTGSSTPFHLMLLDTLLFYPLVDMDSVDDQIMDNVSSLSRYQDGRGVVAMLVVTSPMLANAGCSMTYTNQDGIDKTVTFNVPFSSVIGGIISSNTISGTPNTLNVPFLPLAAGDTGIRKIVSFRNNVSSGGLCCLVLVRPLSQLTLLEVGVPNEVCPVKQMSQLKKIENNACLNFIGLQQGSSAPTGLNGIVEFINI